MGPLIGAVIAVLAGAGIASAAVIGVVKTVQEDPAKPPPEAAQGQADVPIVAYGNK
ncbi:DUF2613 family protein [Kribbella sp. CA-253562]|jgi:hypothetical protein|uniref:DUF2613 family protein n=1 Tax=Kribbella sp. CA-253562 TaxID=3239942 RepID=UPI003D947E77